MAATPPVISGELPPRSSLSEMALSETFGVSRTPIREALKQLQIEGLVEVRPRVGTFVAVPSRREITELFQMKELLEGAAARLLAFRGNVPEVERLADNSESDHEHHRVLDLILAKDGDGAERVMREHVRRSHQALMAGMDDRQQQQD